MFRELGWLPKLDLEAGIRAAATILMANQRAVV
jgi:dTDP-D-glucose 4,6-dehydratase